MAWALVPICLKMPVDCRSKGISISAGPGSEEKHAEAGNGGKTELWYEKETEFK
jgi:hypothetical protein